MESPKKPTVSIDAFGIKLSLGGSRRTLAPSSQVDQERPRGTYVYAHLDSTGQIFYIGRGVGRRAWSGERHHLWQRYVEKQLKNEFRVQILNDNLSDREAELIEGDWITEHAANIVNWDNMAAPFDHEGCERSNLRREANRQLIREGRATEGRSLEEAVAIYLRAIAAIDEYALFDGRGGLVGRLAAEYREEQGQTGEREALDRLTLCLVKLGRVSEAAEHATAYYAKYCGDMAYSDAERIRTRIERAQRR